MLEVLDPPATVWQLVTTVCQRIPPLWDLRNYVAVNPFLGFADQPIDMVAGVVHDGLGANVLPGMDYYQKRWDSGDIDAGSLEQAARNAGCDPVQVGAILTGATAMPTRATATVPTLAERHDLACGTDWDEQVVCSAARWCSVYATQQGQAGNSDSMGLYTSWRETAMVDRSLDLMGLYGFRKWVRDLPVQPADAFQLLEQINIDTCDREAYLYRLLRGVYGWASYFRRDSWQKGGAEPTTVAELLAIRVCLDVAVSRFAPTPKLGRPPTPKLGRPPTSQVEDESVRLVFQNALEDGFVRWMVGKILPPTPAVEGVRPALQAVFCIDVRSEVLRRHLEAESPAIETRGFAGFFGVSLTWTDETGDSARCPVLLQPAVRLSCSDFKPKSLAGPTLRKVAGSPASAFSFVEVLGLTYGIGLVRDLLMQNPLPVHEEDCDGFTLIADGHGAGIPVDARIDLAAGILKNIGFERSFGRLVMLCGHEGHSANNPHAAGLDCGACGGHGGAINARVAAAVLNDPAVRGALVLRGWEVPADTHFLPAVHDTATDHVELLDLDQLPTTHQADVVQLRTWLAHAGDQVRAERAATMGLSADSARRLEKGLSRRAADWSEVRPEWALARNAAFIAARRCRTRGVDLGGRAFLHEYDAALDADNSILNLILSAPMVVASWINLQYFASTVDNEFFGSGDKALHNRVGTLGVVLGNGGDLRTGLALQSVHGPDGQWYHEPLRLQVLVEADCDKIDHVLDAQPGVQQLVQNGWVRLFALDPQSQTLYHLHPGQRWEKFHADADAPDLDVSQ